MGVVPDRRLGQSFLVNDDVAARIAAQVSGLGTLEIGPGLGALTSELLASASRVTSVEISEALCGYVSRALDGPRFFAVRGDFLKVDPAQLPGHPFEAVAGNLPYSVSSRAMVRLTCPEFSSVRRAVLMLQTEVAVRAMTLTGGKEYGRLALALWPHFELRRLLDTGPSSFYPQPEVNSRVVVMERRKEAVVRPGSLDSFSRLVRVGFASRRKTLLNNLSSVVGKARAWSALSGLGISGSLRAEELPPEGFAALAEVIDW